MTKNLAPVFGLDGKQRIEAVQAFVDSKFAIPSSWVDPADVESTTSVTGWPVPGVTLAQLSQKFHRIFSQRPMRAVEYQGESIERQTEIFRLINSGGVDQSEATMARARAIKSH